MGATLGGIAISLSIGRSLVRLLTLNDGDRTLDEWMMIKTSVIDFVLLDLLALLEIVLRVLPSRNLQFYKLRAKVMNPSRELTTCTASLDPSIVDGEGPSKSPVNSLSDQFMYTLTRFSRFTQKPYKLEVPSTNVAKKNSCSQYYHRKIPLTNKCWNIASGSFAVDDDHGLTVVVVVFGRGLIALLSSCLQNATLYLVCWK